MSNRPSGTVTFLFTDIEGSTQLWEHHRDWMERAHKGHEQIIRDAVARHNGYAYKMIGDAFQIAFATAPDALSAAIEAQRALLELGNYEPETGMVSAGPQSPTSTQLRVRMALHTGVTDERGDDYVGPALNRVARVLSAGHGGQILLSQTTYDLVSDQLPPNVSVRDLGEHLLRDLVRREHIFQIVAAELPSQFSALRTLSTTPNNLPIQLTSFIGRAHEMAEVKRLLDTTRLLTLIGSGGAGKTRLSLQVAADLLGAQRFSDGAWLIELAPITDAALVPQAIASALDLAEEQNRPLMQTLTNFLRNKNVLFVLDNCEHLIDACARVADALLHACPGVKFLASSREALGIAGEKTFRVPSLSLPDVGSLPSPETMTQYEAIHLFMDRAAAVQSTFRLTPANASAIAQICYRLDGIPLAIELAAARVKALKVEELSARLDDRFRLLTGGSRTAMPRHQTLRAMMDWSYDLLSENERVLLRRLSVFVGGWSLESAEAVVGHDAILSDLVLDLLTSLVDKSLVNVDEQGEQTRYSMLETVRQYALNKLIESGEAENIRGKHLRYFTRFAEEAEPQFDGTEQARSLNRVETDHDNLRAALDWSHQTDEGAELGQRIACALAEFWVTRGYMTEGRSRISLALESAPERTTRRANLLSHAANLAYRQSDYPATRAYAEQALAIFRELNDKRGISEALFRLGNTATEEGDYETAPRLFEQALSLKRELKDTKGTARALLNLGWAALRPGNYALATVRLEEALALHRSNDDKSGTAFALSGLAEVAVREQNLEQASRLIEQSLAIRKEIGYKWGIGVSLGTWAWIAMRQLDWDAALVRLRESIRVRREIGDKGGMAWCLERLAEVAIATQDDERAVRIYGAAASLRAAMGSVIDPVDQPEYERNILQLKARLGEGALAKIWAAGYGMSMEQSIADALSERHA
jgi:predicted ATPase/class 3 adenylate cyclase